MITLVALIDATAALVTLLTLMILLAHRRSSIGKAIRVLLIFLFVLSFVHNIGNLLEWAGISHVLERMFTYAAMASCPVIVDGVVIYVVPAAFS